MLILRLMFLEIIIVMIFIKTSCALRCRTEDGPSDGELKRVARSCMRKFGDAVFAHNLQTQHQLQHYQQQQHQQTKGNYMSGQRVINTENYGYNYEDSDEGDNDDFYDDQYHNNYNNNNNRNNRQQNGHNNNNNEGGSGHGGNNSGDDDRQHNRSRYSGSNQNRTNNGNNNNNWNYLNQKSNRGNTNNNNSNNRNKNNNSYNNQNNSTTDAACIVHCFFTEMHMLNNNDYPDRHKMLFILTKDLRDRDLRNFYTDTIQECFRYLENQRRRDKCQLSRDLITCMTEYAKGNCDDWNEFSMLFN